MATPFELISLNNFQESAGLAKDHVNPDLTPQTLALNKARDEAAAADLAVNDAAFHLKLAETVRESCNKKGSLASFQSRDNGAQASLARAAAAAPAAQQKAIAQAAESAALLALVNTFPPDDFVGGAEAAFVAAGQALAARRADAARLKLVLADREAALAALPVLGPGFYPDAAAAAAAAADGTGQKLRAREAELRGMNAELDNFAKFGNQKPGSAVRYCEALQQHVDHHAHRVPCAHCVEQNGHPALHGIDRDAVSKAHVTALLADMRRLRALPVAGLSPQELAIREVAIVTEPKGCMIGVLECFHPARPGMPVLLKSYSGKPDNVGDTSDCSPAIVLLDTDPAAWAKPCPTVGGMQGIYTARRAAGLPDQFVPMSAFPAAGPNENPHGNCAAPKLIQKAYRCGLVPVRLAEAWFGKNGGDRVDGEFVVSCITCRKNLATQLCAQVPDPQ